MSLYCEAAAPYVANSAVEGTAVARPFRSHSARCLKCQARHAAMTRTARELAGMKSDRLAAPADLEWKVMMSLEGDLAVERSWRRPLALTAAALSMAVALLIWKARPRST